LSIKHAYSRIVARENLRPDQAQQRIVGALQKLQAGLSVSPGILRSVFDALGRRSKQSPQKGIYLWGGVGRGKTFLMDLFYETLDVPAKRRIHFHRMMRDVHERLRRQGDIQDPLDKVAAAIADETRVLCFDEFFVSDIADAMILGKLLEGLFARGVTLITTSNSPPHDLYADGLQRQRFLPAIALLEQHTDVIELDGGEDYRLRLLQKEGTYLTPADDTALQHLQHFFRGAAPVGAIEARTLDILGRDINTLRCAKGVAWFDFMELCGGPRSQNDYIEIARWYQTIIISDVPLLDRELENPARRFISLVDEFYDRRVKLILSAAADVDSLYQGSKLTFEFQRTASRLTEMQTATYLHEAHLA
jgi:cell division protein ZapE